MNTQKAPEKMTRDELLKELHKLNPFAGYGAGSYATTDALRESLRRYCGDAKG